MGFLGLFLVLHCGDSLKILDQAGLTKRELLAREITLTQDEKPKARLQFRLKILELYPSGWPELELSSEQVAELIKRTFFLYDPKILNADRIFLEGFRLLTVALDPDLEIKKLIQAEEGLGSHPIYTMNDEIKYKLAMALGNLLDSHEKRKSPITRAQLIASFNARGNYVQIFKTRLAGYQSFVKVYEVAARMAKMGHHIKAIHQEFFGNSGQVLMEADIVIEEADKTISIVEVTNQIHENDYKRKFGQFHKYRRFQHSPRQLGAVISKVFVVTIQTVSDRVKNELEKRFGFTVMTF